jgi:phosphoribosylanthranilate isomerase
MRPEDAIAAARAGADLVGMIFVEGVRRQISVDDGASIATALRQSMLLPDDTATEPLPPAKAPGAAGWFQRWSAEIERRLAVRRPLLVGVFANQSLDFINETVEACDLDLVQFSGDEPYELALGVIRPVLKTVKIDGGADPKAVISAITPETIALPLIEPRVAGALGGTGTTLDWSIAREIAATLPVILAGGLKPENVATAVQTVRPWGVDVSSGVETAGQKDPGQITAFVSAVRSLERENEGAR